MEISDLERKNKQKILNTFCEYPNRFFSPKELAIRSGLSLEKARPALAALERNAVLNVVEKRRIKYYQIDRHCPLHRELMRIFNFQVPSVDKDFLTKAVLSCGNIKYAALAGIFVGQVKSDVDLLLVGKVRIKRLERCVKNIARIVGNEINYTVMSEKEFRERLYGFDWFLKEIRERDPVILIDLFSKTGRKRPR